MRIEVKKATDFSEHASIPGHHSLEFLGPWRDNDPKYYLTGRLCVQGVELVHPLQGGWHQSAFPF